MSSSPGRKVVSIGRVIVGFAFIAVTAAITAILALPLLPFRVARIKLHNYYGKLVGRGIVALIGVTPVVQHRERLDGSMPAIYVANHTSALDMFLCIWMCPIGACGVMKREIVFVPFFGWLYLLSGHLRIDRARPEKAMAALAQTAAFVRKHKVGVWIMPEGTRSQDGRLLPFKRGFVQMAIAAGLPVVPVVIHGAHRSWAKGTILDMQPMTVEIQVLEAVDTSAWREETASDHAALVHDLIAAQLSAEQNPLPA